MRAPSKQCPTLQARELAGFLLAVCELGLARRERGMCLGVGISQWIRASGTMVEVKAPRSHRATAREIAAARRHVNPQSLVWARAAQGHDRGCRAFGVSARELERLLKQSDGTEAALLMLEAFEAAAVEVLAQDGGWSCNEAWDTLDMLVRRRITPRTLLIQGRERAGRKLQGVPNPP